MAGETEVKPKPFFKTRISDAPTRQMKLGRGTGIKLVNPEIGARNVDVHINLINIDSGPGEIHYHATAENVYIVLEGMLEVVVEGERYLLGPNEVGFIPPGVVHTAGNAGTHGVCKVIEVYAPAGYDFHEVADWPARNG
jgi:mannose-6-phosphate isomerase-like protein (cupin superfamily)